MPSWLAVIVGVAAGIGSVAAAGKAIGLDKLARFAKDFAADWRGEPERAGFEGTPSFPERMSRLEKRAADTEHFVRGDLASRVEATRMDVAASREQTRENHDALIRLDERVTDHRRRNEEQITLLQRAVDRLEDRLPPLKEPPA